MLNFHNFLFFINKIKFSFEFISGAAYLGYYASY